MTTPLIWLVAVLGVLAVALFFILVLSPSKDGGKEPSSRDDSGISLNTSEGSIVTVRKVGHVTSVTIRSTVHDHWEGSGNVPVPMIPIEVTRLEKPELYSEYINPETSAVRKYEIADELYAEGFTLPYIPGLNEQYKKEIADALACPDDGRVIAERTPIKLNPKPSGEEVRELDINDGLRHAPMEDMGSDDIPEPEQL